ncbi:hypothetical protein CYMTET_45174, partial [Cymbomonas tetramitiformis]
EEDPDLFLARQLQEQERAYFLLGNDFGEYESNSFPEETSAPPEGEESYDDDEAFARALQADEDRQMMARLMAAQMEMTGGAEDEVDDEAAQEENLTYEQLTALGDAVGTQSRGVDTAVMSALPEVSFHLTPRRAACGDDCQMDKCVICQLEFEDGERLNQLPCEHCYHKDCIQQWLQLNKQCPICSKEVLYNTKA